jgi:hypothetical protein
VTKDTADRPINQDDEEQDDPFTGLRSKAQTLVYHFYLKFSAEIIEALQAPNPEDRKFRLDHIPWEAFLVEEGALSGMPDAAPTQAAKSGLVSRSSTLRNNFNMVALRHAPDKSKTIQILTVHNRGTPDAHLVVKLLDALARDGMKEKADRAYKRFRSLEKATDRFMDSMEDLSDEFDDEGYYRLKKSFERLQVRVSDAVTNFAKCKAEMLQFDTEVQTMSPKKLASEVRKLGKKK